MSSTTAMHVFCRVSDRLLEVQGQSFGMQAIQQPRVSCLSCHKTGAGVARFRHSRSQSILCQAHSTQTCTAEQGSAATRRAVLLGLSICTAAAAAIPQQAQAGVTQCDYQKAANGLQWCDTKQGEGKSPVKGASIRCRKLVWPSCPLAKGLTFFTCSSTCEGATTQAG